MVALYGEKNQEVEAVAWVSLGGRPEVGIPTYPEFANLIEVLSLEA